MFERYTDAARRTLFFARHETAALRGMRIEAEATDEPDRLDHKYIGGLASLEQIRTLAEELGRRQAPDADTRTLLDQVHYHLDSLKQHLARM